MGLDTNGLKLLFYLQRNGIQLGKTLTLGRQSYQLNKEQFVQILKDNNYGHAESDGLLKDFSYIEPLLMTLGATEAHSMDASSYESANILHDLNQPVEDQLKAQYDTVFDAGTLEHIFNFPVAIKSCMKMLKIGGHFLGITCANNFSGHGFYQFSPELFFRIFSEENGFRTEKIFFVVNEPGNYWYEVPDPKDLKKRIIFENSKQTFLYIIARKIADKEIFMHIPQQSDYEHLAWQGEQHTGTRKKSFLQSLFFFLSDHTKKNIRRQLRFIDPKALKVFVNDMGNSKKNELKKTKIS